MYTGHMTSLADTTHYHGHRQQPAKFLKQWCIENSAHLLPSWRKDAPWDRCIPLQEQHVRRSSLPLKIVCLKTKVFPVGLQAWPCFLELEGWEERQSYVTVNLTQVCCGLGWSFARNCTDWKLTFINYQNTSWEKAMPQSTGSYLPIQCLMFLWADLWLWANRIQANNYRDL